MYSDVAGTIPAANPIIADGNGFWPQRYVKEAAKVAVTTSADVAIYTLDPVPVAQGTGAAASAISFSPTVDIPQTDVQAAIERAGQLGTSGFAAFGLGITGNAALLANIDSTTLGAGLYRFDGTTTGTLPTGVAAADTGLVEHWRQSAATAMQFLFHATTDRVFHRRMAATAWGTWREVITSDQAPVQGDLLYRAASAWTRLAKGTAGQALVMNAGATAPSWGGAITSSTAQATTSGTSKDFTGIPSGVRRVTITYSEVSLSGTASHLVQLGAGSVLTTGYNSASSAAGGTAILTSTSTIGFLIVENTASRELRGQMILTRHTGNTWVASHGAMSGPESRFGGGVVTLSGELDRVRITSTNGTDTLDLGSVNIHWEF